MKYTWASGYVDTGSPTVGSGRSWKSMEMEIQSLLEKLLDTNDAMSRCAASAAPTTSVTQKLARHRDILHECTQVYYGCYNFIFQHFQILVLLISAVCCIVQLGNSVKPQLCIVHDKHITSYVMESQDRILALMFDGLMTFFIPLLSCCLQCHPCILSPCTFGRISPLVLYQEYVRKHSKKIMFTKRWPCGILNLSPTLHAKPFNQSYKLNQKYVGLLIS